MTVRLDRSTAPARPAPLSEGAPIRPCEFGAVAPLPPPAESPKSDAARAVARFREVVASGRLPAYYDAAIGVGDPALKAEAESLFARLPRLDANTNAEDFVALGLWAIAPRGLEAIDAWKYPIGRQVRVKTNIVVPEAGDPNAYAYDADGPEGVTFRAKIVGWTYDTYLVAVDGRDAPLAVDKDELRRLNDPDVAEEGARFGMQVDYDEPLLKAKVCEAALAVGSHAARLDFGRQAGMAAGGAWHQVFAQKGAASTVEIQHDALRAVHSVLDMMAPRAAARQEPGRAFARDVGRAAVKSVGTGIQQSTTLAAVLAPFASSLGFETTLIVGGLHQFADAEDPAKRLRQLRTPGMAWLEVTSRPGAETVVSDRTWRQPAVARERAYSPDGGRYPIGPMRDRGTW